MHVTTRIINTVLRLRLPPDLLQPAPEQPRVYTTGRLAKLPILLFYTG